MTYQETTNDLSVNKSLNSVFNGNSLDSNQSEKIFGHLFSGQMSEIELSGLLMAMKLRGEKAEEISGAAKSMRKFCSTIDLGTSDIFDTCGTGGDYSGSFNISSSVAVILSALGIPIAKHGNRSVSGKSGSTDFYENLGVPVNLTGDEAVNYFKKHNFIYMAAPNYHPAMRYAVSVRKKLAVRTIFNYLGPLTNPAGTKKQAIGFFSPALLPLYAETALSLLYERCVIYSSLDGMDEVSPLADTIVYEIESELMDKFTIQPRKYISEAEARLIPSGLTPEENALLFIDTVSSGKSSPLAKLLALNSALSLYGYESKNSIDESYKRSLQVILDGTVHKKLKELKGEI
ncbi:MAG TPA: anthranilate phosphoribosyltransferase [Spirochaetota bacterium]|nr:anthranilate phosphoribosyltransferase [Spirochaetota bacterium]HPS87673.1 anthranilate phosphoribosyltransferase [Spirochaetota bacterium]